MVDNVKEIARLLHLGADIDAADWVRDSGHARTLSDNGSRFRISCMFDLTVIDHQCSKYARDTHMPSAHPSLVPARNGGGMRYIPKMRSGTLHEVLLCVYVQCIRMGLLKLLWIQDVKSHSCCGSLCLQLYKTEVYDTIKYEGALYVPHCEMFLVLAKCVC